LTVLECGGLIAGLRHKSNATNPLWIQNQPTIDSDLFNPAVHGKIYGTEGEVRLISGLTGRNLCFPYWGYLSEAEHRAGMTAHGETHIRRWELQAHTSNSLALSVALPDRGMEFSNTPVDGTLRKLIEHPDQRQSEIITLCILPEYLLRFLRFHWR
jgi:hypothetical protein